MVGETQRVTDRGCVGEWVREGGRERGREG